jgi:hypothetical protein
MNGTTAMIIPISKHEDAILAASGSVQYLEVRFPDGAVIRMRVSSESGRERIMLEPVPGQSLMVWAYDGVLIDDVRPRVAAVTFDAVGDPSLGATHESNRSYAMFKGTHDEFPAQRSSHIGTDPSYLEEAS